MLGCFGDEDTIKYASYLSTSHNIDPWFPIKPNAILNTKEMENHKHGCNKIGQRMPLQGVTMDFYTMLMYIHLYIS